MSFAIEAVGGVFLLLLAAAGTYALFEIADLLHKYHHMGITIMATLNDLTNAIDALGGAVTTLQNAAASGGAGADFTLLTDRVNNAVAAIDAVSASLAPPPAP